MGASSCSDIKDSLRHLYLEDPRPWLVGFSGGKQSLSRLPVMGSGTRVVSPERNADLQMWRIAHSQAPKPMVDALDLEVGDTAASEGSKTAMPAR